MELDNIFLLNCSDISIEADRVNIKKLPLADTELFSVTEDDIRKNIKSGLDFGTATVDFASSGLGVSSSGIINSMGYVRSGGMSVPGSIELKLTSEDGQIFGRWMVPFIRSEDKSNPEVVSDAV